MKKELKIREEIMRWCKEIKVMPVGIIFKKMEKCWGNMSTDKILTINTDIFDLPAELIELVIVHELVHMLVFDHGKMFKLYMCCYIADWQSREKELNKYSLLGKVA